MAKTAESKYKYRIGIGVTEHNRPEVFAEFLKNIKKFMPDGAKFVIVDDASTVPVKGSTYRFEANVGIATAKNKCIELLDDCEHIFLFDSDSWPKVKNWWKPYVEGPEPHYCYIFKDLAYKKLNDSDVIYEDESISAYSHPRGCMLYMHHDVLDVVGGMDQHYKRWGYEHVDYSNRIYNAGLTLFRYQDVPNSHELIFSGDEEMTVASTVSVQERQPYLRQMRDYFLRSFQSTAYCQYKTATAGDGEDIVITVYFTGVPDPQREQWVPDIEHCRELIDSLNGRKLVILHDCFDEKTKVPDNVELVRVTTGLNPYFQRWLSIWQYLRDHKDVRNVFCVDATDVTMLRDPFPHIQANKLYLGCETGPLNNAWLINHHRVPFIIKFIRRYPRIVLLNPGVIGGSREDVMSLLRKMNQIYYDEKGKVGEFDMGLFNYVARTFFNGKIVAGSQVNTRFKAFETDNQVAWWKHK